MKKVSFKACRLLAEKIRKIIARVTAKNGGHLASNLGVVELTMALHRVFDFPKDQVVFDVSHQSYTYKLLTHRARFFHTLRRTGGLSGFTSPKESSCDLFYCGHAGTALSSALGLAKARDLLHKKHHVIAIIGDASLTNGLTLEALNNIGNTRLLVILNDNGYAIAPNVGCIAKYLNGIMRSSFYNRSKAFLKRLFYLVPFGGPLLRICSRIKRQVKSFFLPSSFFEYYGFRYVGPVDGHNLRELVEALKFCKKEKRPTLLHVKTKKGHGNPLAEQFPEKMHGVSPNIQASVIESKITGYSKIFGETLCQLAKKDPRIVAITAAMPQGTGLEPFSKQFSERFFDVGIAEGHAVTFAAGLSKAGLLPVCAIYSTFLQRAFDNIFHDIAIQKLPVIFAIDRAGLCANDGPTHHGLFDLAYLQPIPNLVIMQPKDPTELQAMLTFSVGLNAACCIRYPRTCTVLVDSSINASIRDTNSSTPIIYGKSEILQEGGTVCLIALGERVYEALEIAKRLSSHRFTIINARFVKPLDETLLLKVARQHHHIYTFEDHVEKGGFGESVVQFLLKINPKLHCHIFAWPNEFLPHASNDDDLKKKYHLTIEDYVQKISQDLAAVD